MARYKFSIGTKKKGRPKGKTKKKRGNVEYRRAEGTGEPLRAARMLAGY